MPANITYRQQIQPSDVDAIYRIVQSSGFFSPAEIDLALELAKEKLVDDASSYQFLFGEEKDLVCGYTCFGLIPATAASFDLYWIAVDEHMRHRGLGRELMIKTEQMIFSLGGKHIYAETSSRNQYRPTQNFYERCGYFREAILKDFYTAGDSKIIYSKEIK
jgi:ribosomal protein S18 acetylase RimI-like enzyme